VNDYCFVYEVRDGKVWRIREYMGTRGGWAQVFGDSEPAQLLDASAAADQRVGNFAEEDLGRLGPNPLEPH
jgi:hypothetical protein